MLAQRRAAMVSRTIISVQSKIALAVVVVFSGILVASILITAQNERQLALEIAEDKAIKIGESYFDGLNTLMLTRSWKKQKALLSKYLEDDNVVDIRVPYAPQYKEEIGDIESPPMDELDQRALSGETVSVVGEDEHGRRTMTVVSPIPASSDYLGTNCLRCHDVPENSIVAAVRTTYSLAELDNRTTQHLLKGAAVNLVIFALGIGLVFWLMRKIVISPLLDMRHSMENIEKHADLSQRLKIRSKDEVGALASAINGMLDRFRDSLKRVADTSQQLSTAAEQISAVSERTVEAAGKQRMETDVCTGIIGNLQAIAQKVGDSASETVNASVDAEQQASQSTSMTRESIAGILALVAEIEQAAKVINKLDDRTRDMSKVLDVIRNIAEQTNLLALNAAIEAARAGEAGRGFTVVADEVRKLATQSQESTSSIEAIVVRVQKEARETVGVMDKARNSAESNSEQLEQAVASLDQIVLRVTDIRSLNEEMSHSVETQRQLTDDVNQRMSNVNGIADQTADEADQTRSVSGELVELARELSNLVDQFNLGRS
jgi:methyl-accepting chemotaxis protein